MMLVGCQSKGRDSLLLSLDRLFVGNSECRQFRLEQTEFLGIEHNSFLIFLLNHDIALDRLIIIVISPNNGIKNIEGLGQRSSCKKKYYIIQMLEVQRYDEISMNQAAGEQPGPPQQISLFLKTHTMYNQKQVRTLLGLYREQLPSQAILQQKILEQLQRHFQRRYQIAKDLLQGRQNKEKIMLYQCRQEDKCPEKAELFIQIFDGRVDQASYQNLSEKEQQEHLAFVAGECIAELQWEQALPPLLKLISLQSKMKSPAFHLAMVVLAATANATLQQRLQDALLLESELEQMVFEEMANRNIKINKQLQTCRRNSTDLYNIQKMVMQLIKDIQDINQTAGSDCKKFTEEQNRQLQSKKKELQDFLKKNCKDGPLFANLLQAMAHNCNHNHRSLEDTRRMLVSLSNFERNGGADTIRKKMKVYQLQLTYPNSARLHQIQTALTRYINESPQPQPFHSDLTRNALKRRQKEVDQIRASLHQFKEQSVPDEPKHKLKQSPIFQRQKGRGQVESHDSMNYEEWQFGRIKVEPKREEEKKVVPMSELEKRSDELAQAVGLMTFYWQGESGQELKTVQGTGFLISGQVVVTAKHNFYHKSQKGRCSGCTIQFSNPSDPFNSITYHSKQSNEWFEDPNLDVGAVFLEQPVRHFRGNIRLATRNDILQLREREREQLLVMGYSLQNRQAITPDKLNHLSSVLLGIKQPYLQYTSNTLGGHSGSPVFSKFIGRQCLVVGVHVSRKIQGDVCRGIFMNDRIASQISAWAKQILSNQIYLPQSFQALSKKVMKEMQMYNEEVLLVNRDANFPQVMELLRQRVLQRRGDRKIIEEISCKLLPLLQDRDIQQFYSRLYTKDGVVQARNELIRLGFRQPPPLPAYELAQFREPQKNAHADGEKRPPSQQADEECSQIVIGLKSSDESTKSEQGDGGSDTDQWYGDEESCMSQQSSQKQQELEEFEQQENVSFTEELKIVITYKPLDYFPRESPYLSFLKMRRVATQATVSHLSYLDNVFLGSQRVGRVEQWSLGVVVEKGWEDWQWVSLLKHNKGLLLLLIRDMVSMVMELQQKKIYLANLQKRNIVLYSLQRIKYSETAPEKCLHDLSQLRFKFANFENTLCLANEQTSKPAFNMISLGRKLAGNEYMDMEPITPMLCERGRDALQHRFKEQYSASLSSQISYLADYEGARLLSSSQREYLQDLCRQQRYPQIISFLDEAIANLQ